MSIDDKAKNAAENAEGKGKEAAGRVTGDDKMKTEGKTDQATSSVKDAAEDVKDVFKK